MQTPFITVTSNQNTHYVLTKTFYGLFASSVEALEHNNTTLIGHFVSNRLKTKISERILRQEKLLSLFTVKKVQADSSKASLDRLKLWRRLSSPAEALGIRVLHNVGTSFTSHVASCVITALCLPLFADPMTLTYSLVVSVCFST